MSYTVTLPEEEERGRYTVRLPALPEPPKDAYVQQAGEDSNWQNLTAGIGGAMMAPVLGARQIASNLGVGKVDPQEIEDWKRSMKGLWTTPMGKVGTVTGGIATALPAMLIPGAASVPGAMLTGAAMGALEPVGDGDSRASNTAFGSAFGLGGKVAGDLVGKGVSSLYNNAASSLAARKAANVTRDATVRQAQGAGYVLPPSQVSPEAPGAVNRVLEGFAGKLTTAQEAGIKNQKVTNALAKAEVGLSGDSPLTTPVLEKVRREAGKAYAALKEVPHFTVDKDYGAALKDTFGQYRSRAVEFPSQTNAKIEALINDLDRPQFSSSSVVDLVKNLRFQGFKNVKAQDPDIAALGQAQLGAQNMLEDLIERNLAATGQKALLTNYQKARVLIAKAHSIENALEESTGNVVAGKIGREFSKGRPLTDNLKTIGQTAEAFPKALQNVNTSMPGLSPLDTVAGLMASIATGDVRGLALPFARPVARSVMLSKPYQKAMAAPPSYEVGAITKGLSKLDNEELRKLLQAASTGGLLSIPQQ
jgi:hypothetical protein